MINRHQRAAVIFSPSVTQQDSRDFRGESFQISVEVPYISHTHLQQEQQLRISLAGALAIPCAACGWIHRHGLAHPLPPLCEAARLKRRETTTTERGHVKRARTQHQERRTYEKRRREVNYRFSMFKVQAARRGKTVELQRHEFARILRQQCFYCSSTEWIGVDRVQNDGHRAITLANFVPCCAS